jgi:hypothetical protein
MHFPAAQPTYFLWDTFSPSPERRDNQVKIGLIVLHPTQTGRHPHGDAAPGFALRSGPTYINRPQRPLPLAIRHETPATTFVTRAATG